ncbi:MAG: sugar phosphate isomerase/epimerase family protein [bacterium]
MQRRTLLQLLSGTAGAFLLNKAAPAQSTPPRWKTAVGLNGFASGSGKYGKNYPIWEILDFASRTGFDGIELVDGWPTGGYPGPDDVDRIHALHRLYDGFGLQIFSIQLGVAGAFDPDVSARNRWLEQFRERARFAKAAGCDCIGMWPGGGLRGQTIDQAIERLAESFHQAAEIAAGLELIPAFEIEPPFVFNTEEHMKCILAKANHPSLKVIYDPSHFDLMNGSLGRPHEMLQRIGVENIGYLHLTDTDGTLRDGGTSKHLPCGDGRVDIDLSLRILRDGGFSGWIMIDAWEIPDPYDACIKGKKAIDRANPAVE